MKKLFITFFVMIALGMLSPSAYAAFSKLYIVGDASSAGWSPENPQELSSPTNGWFKFTPNSVSIFKVSSTKGDNTDKKWDQFNAGAVTFPLSSADFKSYQEGNTNNVVEDNSTLKANTKVVYFSVDLKYAVASDDANWAPESYDPKTLDFSDNTYPDAISIQIEKGGIDAGEYPLAFNSGVWSFEFTPTTETWLNFKVKVYTDKGQSTEYIYWYAENIGQSSVNSNWSTSSLENESTFYQSGLTKDKTYILELTAADSDKSKFKWRVVAAPDKPTVGALTFSPASGAIKNGGSVTITCPTAGATIYYTTDGSDPKTSASKKTYSATNKPVLTTTNKTLKAYATLTGYNDSAVKEETYNVMPVVGADLNVCLAGVDFNYIGENNESWNGWGANWAFKNDKEEVIVPAMIWDTEKQWYTMTIKPTKTSIQYKFFVKIDNSLSWFSLNNTPNVQSNLTEPKTWSSNFSSDNENNLKNEGLSISRTYKVFLKQDASGAFQYAIISLPQETKPYTVKLDISQMGARMWTPSDVKVVAGGSSYSYTSAANNVITFTFQAGSKPGKVYFTNDESSTDAVNKTDNFDFVDGKTYTLGFINTYRKDGLSYAWKSISVSEEAKKVNLPYGPNDFKEPKYFLVGARMGNWHLQPEWELIKQDDGSYQVNGGRFVFRTNFAVAKVNSYYNYTQQIYQLVTRADATAGMITSAQTIIENLDLVDPDDSSPDTREFDTSGFGYQEGLDDTYADIRSAKDGGLAMTFLYNGAWYKNDDEKNPASNRSLSANDKGTWVNKITLTPVGAKFKLSFAIDKDNTVNIDQRLFTLVGGDINHKGYLDGNYSPDGTDAKIVTNRSYKKDLQQAWQESWIQYDESGKPYYDGNGQFLYHTAFVPSIFDDAEVKFRLDNVNGKNFDYTSSSITFVEANQLSDLKNDPYREFYKALEGSIDYKAGTEFSGGKKEDGTDFAFKLGNISRDFEAKDTNFKVFVIRDAWVRGEFKIWNGWSGNSISYEKFASNYGDGGNAARWNKLNAGPEGSDLKEIVLTDINAGVNGTPQKMDKLSVIENGTDVNYHTPKVNDKYELQYYNRIILLYNTAQDNALDNSYVFFIQDDTQPVIKGFANDDKTAHAEWNLVNIKANDNETITGYTITRYTVTDDGNVNPKVIKTEKELEIKTTEVGNREVAETAALNPGTYFYNIKVTVKTSDGTSEVREANSNRFVIYGEAITPQLRVDQLIVLTKAGYDAIRGTRYAEGDKVKSYPGLKTRFEAAFRSTTTNAVREYASDRFYLTYKEDNLDADHYAIYAGAMGEGDDANQNITQMTEVSAQEVINFMKEPTYYKWAARFYVRALNKTEFDREYSRQSIEVEDLQITLTDKAAADLSKALHANNDLTDWETNSENIATSTYTVRKLNGTSVEFVGSIVDRAGFLGEGEMIAEMTYKYGDKTAETKDVVDFVPVAPLPYDLTAEYVYRSNSFGNPVADHIKSQFGNNVSNNFKGHIQVFTHSTAHPKTGEHEPYTVKIPEDAVSQERHLDCVIKFTRPNVSEAIFQHYNVQYTLSLQSVVEEGASFADLQDYIALPEDGIKGTYVDLSEIEYVIDPSTGKPQLDDNDQPIRLRDKDGDPVRTPYEIVIPNTHPSGKIYPLFQINSVIYERTNAFGGDNYRIAGTYMYDELKVARKNTRSADIEAGDFALGYNEPNPYYNETAPRWYLQGHKDFTYGGATPSTDVDVANFKDTEVFLVEITNPDTKETVAGHTLWWHNDAVNCYASDAVPELLQPFADQGYKIEKNPLFINNMKVDGGVPSLTLTPVYLFIRDLDLDPTKGSAQFRDLVPVGGTANAQRKKVIRRAGEQSAQDFSINTGNKIMLQTTSGREVESTKYNAAEHGTITGATYDATVNHPELIVSPGEGTVPSNGDNPPIMTGIEDVMTDGAAANGEAVYYNLQGIQVANPVKGQIYIRKAGNVSEKVVF